MVLQFYKTSPGGNSTILILDSIPPLKRASLAKTLMDEHHLQAEQVGYLDLQSSPIRLEMMGGEFCGNACRAAAAVLAHEKTGLIKKSKYTEGEISVSGVEHPVQLRLDHDHQGPRYWVRMPLKSSNVSSFIQELDPGLTLVTLPGITHLCVDETLHPFPHDYINFSQKLREHYGLKGPAVGCVWYAPKPSYSIKPVVWVRETASTHYETGCGSGTLAIALCWGQKMNLPQKNLPLNLQILQPSGSFLGVEIHGQGKTLEAWIYGPVTLIAKGQAFIPNVSSEWLSE